VTKPRIRRLIIECPATLRLTWKDGTSTQHDMSALIRKSWAAPLRDPKVFRAATLDEEGWQVVWPGTDVALSAQGLWDDVHSALSASDWMSADEFSAWMHELSWSFAQAAEALGISKRMLKYYAAGTHSIPKTVWLACMHLASAHRRRHKPADAA
jgi:Protein of unknown function (DUF2442)